MFILESMKVAFVLLLAASAMWCSETPLRILFIGNSYTYFNNLAGLVEGMARTAGGRAVEARSVARDTGSWTLQRVGP